MATVTPHREVFARLVDELTARLEEIAALRSNRDVGNKLAFFDQSLELFGVKDWPTLIGANDEPITRWHVETGEMMLDLAARTLQILRGPPPTTPPPHAQAMAMGARGR